MKVGFKNVVRTVASKNGKRTAAALLLAAVSFWALSQIGFVRLEFALRESGNGHLEDLSPLAEYLAPALEAKDYPLLSARSSYLESAMKRNRITNDASEAFELLDQKELDGACASFWKSADGPFGKRCETESLDQESASGKIHECSKFRFEETRKECRGRNDVLFSKFSDAHCSKAECVVDNAVYRSKILRAPACFDIHPSLRTECLRIAEIFDRYSADPSSFAKPELESALMGKTSDPILLAARSAVLEFPDSPSSACSKFWWNERAACETKSKELFSYVQFRGLKNRFERIADAIKKQP